MVKVNKTCRVEVRLTAEQKRKLVGIAKEYNLSLSELIIQKTLGKRAIFKQKELIKLMEDIAIRDKKVDTNINQIAKILNTNYKNLDDNRLLELFELINKFNNKQQKLSNNIRSIYRLLANDS